MKVTGRLILTLFAIFMLSSCLYSCKESEEDMIWDYSPVDFEILVENSKGENLLDENVADNILNTKMYIIFQDERYEVYKGWPEGSIFPYRSTRVYMPIWYGAFIAPYFFDYSHWEDVPERGNRLYVGEFFGDSNGETSFQLHLDGHEYKVAYTNKIVKPGKVDRHFFLNDKEIPSSSFEIIL